MNNLDKNKMNRGKDCYNKKLKLEHDFPVALRYEGQSFGQQIYWNANQRNSSSVKELNEYTVKARVE